MVVTEPDSRGNVEMLLRVARQYYEQGRTQAEIARDVGYSRPSVSRMLSQARKQGIVKVTISHPLERILSIERTLRETLSLMAVRVAEVQGTDVIDAIGRAGADLLIDSVSDGQVIAVGNGRSIQATAQHIPPIGRVNCTVVQSLGSVPGGIPAWGRDAPTVCTRIASQLGAMSARMSVPLIVDDPTLLRPLMREEKVATTLALAARADVALVGVAGIHARGVGNILAEYLTPAVREAIRAGGAVGHTLDQHYDAAGRHVVTPLTPRTLALSLDELRRIPLVIGVAAGEDKIEAIVAAARGGIIDALATDEQTAAAILEMVRAT